jgi:hypothetical protein
MFDFDRHNEQRAMAGGYSIFEFCLNITFRSAIANRGKHHAEKTSQKNKYDYRNYCRWCRACRNIDGHKISADTGIKTERPKGN